MFYSTYHLPSYRKLEIILKVHKGETQREARYSSFNESQGTTGTLPSEATKLGLIDIQTRGNYWKLDTGQPNGLSEHWAMNGRLIGILSHVTSLKCYSCRWLKCLSGIQDIVGAVANFQIRNSHADLVGPWQLASKELHSDLSSLGNGW